MHLKDISQELRFLISVCSRSRLQVKHYISEFDGLQRLDESMIFRLSQRHRVEPLVWAVLKEFDIFSDEVRSRFEIAFRQNQLKSLRAKAIESRLRQILHRNNAKGLLLKGSGIAERYYDDIAERHVLDIDLYVGREGLNQMIFELQEIGYAPVIDLHKFNDAQFDFFKSTHHDIYFAPKTLDGLLPIELHWRIQSPWSDFEIKPFDGFNAEDEFLYLCVHGTEHGWFRLKWLMDLPRIIMKADFEWTVLWKRAIALNCKHHFCITLILMDELCIFPIPVELSGQIRKAKYRFQMRYIIGVLSSDGHFNDNDRNRWQYFRYLFSLSSKRFNFSFFRQFLTSPKDWQIVRISERWFFLYYLLRPFLWAYRRVVKS